MITNVDDPKLIKKTIVFLKKQYVLIMIRQRIRVTHRNNVLSMLSWDNLTSDTSKELKLVIDTFESMLQLDGIRHLCTLDNGQGSAAFSR